MRQERIAENQETEENTKEEELSREWVLDNFWLRDNPIIKANPEVGEELIQTLQKKGRAFKGGAVRDQVIGQGVAGRSDWIIVCVELKPQRGNSGQQIDFDGILIAQFLG